MFIFHRPRKEHERRNVSHELDPNMIKTAMKTAIHEWNMRAEPPSCKLLERVCLLRKVYCEESHTEDMFVWVCCRFTTRSTAFSSGHTYAYLVRRSLDRTSMTTPQTSPLRARSISLYATSKRGYFFLLFRIAIQAWCSPWRSVIS